VQSGFSGPTLPASWVLADANGRELWSGHPGPPDPKHYADLVTRVFAEPSGDWIVGGHREFASTQGAVPFLIRVPASRRPMQRVDLPMFLTEGGYSTVQEVTADDEGDAWFVTGDLSYRGDHLLGRMKARSVDIERRGRISVQDPLRRRVLINSIFALSESEVRRRDCMYLPKERCMATVLAAGGVEHLRGETSAALISMDAAGRGIVDEMRESATEQQFSWVGATPCCRLVGTSRAGGKMAFLFAEANELFLVDSASAVRFAPPGESSCRAVAAVELDDDRLVAVGTCESARVYVVAFHRKFGVAGFSRVCGEVTPCSVGEIKREDAGGIILTTLDKGGLSLSSFRLEATPGTPPDPIDVNPRH